MKDVLYWLDDEIQVIPLQIWNDRVAVVYEQLNCAISWILIIGQLNWPVKDSTQDGGFDIEFTQGHKETLRKANMLPHFKLGLKYFHTFR